MDQKHLSNLLFIGVIVLIVGLVGYLLVSQSPRGSIQSEWPTKLPQSPAERVSAPITQSAEDALAFTDSDGEIWIVNKDGSGLTKITNDEFIKFHLNVSPDRKKIAYSFYPRDETKQTNSGLYAGVNSGIGVVFLDTKQTKTLVPYEEIQNYYPVWSPDSRYLSVWVGTGKKSIIVDAERGGITFTASPAEKGASPIVWVPHSQNISFVLEGELTVIQPDGRNETTLATRVDALRPTFESPTVPEPPQWSPDGRYVVYYRDGGDLYVHDTVKKSERLLRGAGSEGEEGEIFSHYPQAFLGAFSEDSQRVFLIEPFGETPRMRIYDLPSDSFEETPLFARDSNMTVSPRGDVLTRTAFADRINPFLYPHVRIFSTNTKAYKTCPSEFDYWYNPYAGGLEYSHNLPVWSPDSQSVVGFTEDEKLRVRKLKILDVATCEVKEIVSDKLISEATWFPR